MDTSGTQGTNMTNQTSPFAPIDIPDVNNIPAPSAMPPMGVSGIGMADIPEPALRPEGVQAGAGAGAQTTSMSATSAPNATSASGMSTDKSSEPAKSVPTSNASTKVDDTTRSTGNAAGGQKTAAQTSGSTTTSGSVANGAASADKAAPVAPPANTAPVVVAVPTGVNNVEIATPSAVQSLSGGVKITIEPLLEECIRQNASDLHLQVGLSPILRVDGVLRPMTTYPALDNEAVQKLVFSTLDEDQQKILIKDKEFDYSFAFGDLGRFRVNAFHEKGNMAAAFRLIPNVIRSVQDLGLPGVIEEFANHPNGLVLVTGPTGSGKSTTLAALIDKINTERADHIITIEDPIEFTHPSKRSVVAQREVHYDTYSFAAALRSILREDPDVVLIGEMRDLETIQAAITVAETGHLVFGTLHTNSAAQSIDRMIDVFPAHQQPQIRAQLANILIGICSQRLIPAIDGGRVVVAEVMLANTAVRSIIREGKTHQLDMTIQTGADQGMQTMDRELARYVKGGVISYDVAREFAVDTAEFDRLARG